MKLMHFGHTFAVDDLIFDLVVPKNIRDKIMMISSAWNNEMNKGETVWYEAKDKTYYEMREGIKLKQHKTKLEMNLFHKNIRNG